MVMGGLHRGDGNDGGGSDEGREVVFGEAGFSNPSKALRKEVLARWPGLDCTLIVRIPSLVLTSDKTTAFSLKKMGEILEKE
jgi:hypothetical protein